MQKPIARSGSAWWPGGRVSAIAARSPPGEEPTARAASMAQAAPQLAASQVPDVMGVPLNTVKSHIRRGKERLALELRPALHHEPVAGVGQ